MLPKILLYNDNSKRDLLGIRLIEEELKRKNCITKICNPDTLKSSLFTFKPNAFVAARADHTSPVFEISKLCKIFIVPGEGGQQTKETILSVFMGRSYYKLKDVSWISRCYLWGYPTYDWLMETGLFKKNQLLVSGNSRIDIYRKEKYFKKANNILTLGIAFSSKSTSTYYGDLDYAYDYYKIPENEEFPIAKKGRFLEDIMWRDHTILRIMMQTIRKILNDFPNINIILRPSPFENPRSFKFLEKESNGRLIIKDRQPLPEFIKDINLMLTCWSTTGLEAIINKIPVISIYNFIDQKHLFQHISKQASGFNTYVHLYHNPKNYNEIKKMITKFQNNKLKNSPVNDSGVNKILKQLYNWPSKKSSSKLIAEDIINYLKKSKIKKINSSQIKKIFPSKYPIPIILKPLIHNIFAFYKYFKSGAFRPYYDFRKLKDKKIEKLVKLYFEE